MTARTYTHRFSRRPEIDPVFVRCIKEEVEEGELVTIVVASEADVPAWEACFTDEELDSITFAVREVTP